MLPALPAAISPPAPFPLVVAQSQTQEFVAPGVRRATYRLQTSDGPLVIHLVAVDLLAPTLRFGTVLAQDRMISAGETTSSMARRTGAIAGVNGDYFDIGNTNQPLGVLVRDGALVRSPSKRVALDVRADRSVHFEPIAFSGTVTYGATTVPLTGVNVWPPERGVSFLTADYGAIRPAPGVTLAELVSADAAHAATSVGGTYRVAALDDVAPSAIDGPMLAFGPAARAIAPPPGMRDTVTVAASTDPALDQLACAVGGGPLLVTDGRPADDPNEPAPEERERRFPVSGAAAIPQGGLLLASVDGRRPALSIGVTRPQFAALLLAFGATSAMAFDSGGSATLVARQLGDASASVLGAPSDGEERHVADGFFVYSDTPVGPASALVVRPANVVTLPHAVVPVRLALVDAVGHGLGATHLPGGDTVRAGATPGPVVVRAGGQRATVTVDVVERLARVDVTTDARAVEPGAVVHVAARGFDDRGREVDLGDAVRLSADRGKFVAPARYRASSRDARIVARAGGATGETVVRVGSHPRRVDFPGGSAPLRLSYDFSGTDRTAIASVPLLIPGEPLAFGVEVLGDGSGIGLRATFVNRFGERRALTLARRVDWNGWQARAVALPDDLNPPVRLVSFDAVDASGNARTHASGSIAFRNPIVTLAGTP